MIGPCEDCMADAALITSTGGTSRCRECYDKALASVLRSTGIGPARGATISMATTGIAAPPTHPEPNPSPSVLQLFDDDQLRAECERRGISANASPEVSDLKCIRDSLRMERDSAREQLRVACEKWKVDATERDEWKRRAEAAEAVMPISMNKLRERLATASPKMLRQMAAEAARLVCADERGPGIAATPAPDTGHYVDPWDFLEDA